MRQRKYVCSTIPASFDAWAVVFPFATATSICRSRFTTSSGWYFLPRPIRSPCPVSLFQTGTFQAGHSKAIEQEFLVKDPTRTLKIPKNLRPKDKQILTWEQMGAILAKSSRRDRVILMLDMTDALRPSELFALRWRSYDDGNTLSLTETVYRRQLRPFGKTIKSLGKMHLPDGLAAELTLWKLECPDPSPEAFMFPNADGGFLDTSNYRSRILKPLADELGIPKLNFQVLRRTMATRAQNLGSVKDIQSHLRHSRADTTANEYMQELPESVQQMVGAVYDMLTSATAQQQAA